MSSVSAAAQQSTTTVPSAGAASTGGSASSTGNAALNSLSSNFSDFLNLLLTQLKNQDPTSPVDSSQFTTELVQFSQVEQQINTNSALNTLIQTTQTGQVLQGAAMVGKTAEVSASQLSLQNGSAAVNFMPPSAGTVTITVSNAQGVPVYQQSVAANAGANQWTWNGQNSAGQQLPDGAYGVAVTGAASGGTAQTVPFTVDGTVTGVTNTSSGGLQLQMGGLSTSFSNLQSVGN
jgi:flagellar basal-body rod modification protein FlgD